MRATIRKKEVKPMNKKQFDIIPDSFKDKQLWGFNWLEYVTAIPAPLVLVTGYKKNGNANGTMQSWFCFSNENDLYCIFGSVNKYTHMYEIAHNQKQFAVNFPDKDVIGKCMATIENNDYEKDELSACGLTYGKCAAINAPIVNECFLNLECEVAWEKSLFDGSDNYVICAKVVNVWFDENKYKNERYGENGYLYNIHAPMNPETGVQTDSAYGVIKKL